MVKLWSFLWIILLFLDVRLLAYELGQCTAALGMESGQILDKDITASSVYDVASVGPQLGRLQNDKSGGAWCPKVMVTKEANEYLEINLHNLHVITGTKTQGRFGNGHGQEYTEEFMLDYWRPGFKKWQRWRGRNSKEKLQGNVNTFSIQEQKVDPPIHASKIRFVPYSDHGRTICMRTELLGCFSYDGLLSYSMTQGVQRGNEVDLTDQTYDGQEDGGQLHDGLGQLFDGERGLDNFRLDLRGNGKGYEWVGWRNDTTGGIGRPVEIVFEFDKVRNFSAMYIHTNNMFSKDVQVFSHAKVFFSNDGRRFSQEPVYFSYMPDLIMEHARNVTVKLHNRMGKFVRLQLYFASKWILVSEVSFDSVIATGIFSDPELDNNVLYPPEDNTISKEYPLQRDEVQTTPSRDDRRHHMVPLSPAINQDTSSSHHSSEPKQYIGLIIGVLSTVIVILMSAIMFIIVRNRRLKAGLGNSATTVVPTGFVSAEKGVTINMKDFQMRVSMNSNGHVYGQVSVEDPEDKSAIYHEPYNMNMYTGVPPAQMRKAIEPGRGRRGMDGNVSPEYTDVPDLVAAQCQDYAVPHVMESKQPPVRSLPSLHNFFPKPPPVPPPPEKYYATADVCKANGDRSHQQVTHHISSPIERRKTQTQTHKNNVNMYGLLSPHMLSDNNTDSEFPVTETEDEGCEDDCAFLTITFDQLTVIEPLGYGQFGEIKLCELLDGDEIVNSSLTSCKLVAVKLLRTGASDETINDFRREAKLLTKIKDTNIVRVLGGNLCSEPLYVVVEYMEYGDLNQLLQEHIADTTSPLPTNAKTLSYGCLIYMATQIASGMKYLESLNFVHRDLATRNCLVGKHYAVKVSDLGMSKSLYSGDYYQLEGRAVLPIRWMAWESILLGKFTTKSDVWSFAVTLWEVLTFAREQPFEELTDEKVLENVSHFYQDDGQHLLLSQPKNCPKEIFDLMRECWQRNESDRPNFREIHLFLQRKNLGYKI